MLGLEDSYSEFPGIDRWLRWRSHGCVSTLLELRSQPSATHVAGYLRLQLFCVTVLMTAPLSNAESDVQ